MPNKTRPYREALLESLSDPDTAASYLTAAMSDSAEMFRKALRNVAQSRQMAKVARDAGVTRESLYRATSEIGNPTLDTLESVLSAMDINIEFKANVTAPVSSPSSPTGSSIVSGVNVVRTHADVSASNKLFTYGPSEWPMNYIGSQSTGFDRYYFAEKPIVGTGFTLLGNSTNINQNGTLPSICTIVPNYLSATMPTARMINGLGQESTGNANSILNPIYASA